MKLLVPTCFAIFGYPWQWVETKWRWLATQDHAKLVYWGVAGFHFWGFCLVRQTKNTKFKDFENFSSSISNDHRRCKTRSNRKSSIQPTPLHCDEKYWNSFPLCVCIQNFQPFWLGYFFPSCSARPLFWTSPSTSTCSFLVSAFWPENYCDCFRLKPWKVSFQPFQEFLSIANVFPVGTHSK